MNNNTTEDTKESVISDNSFVNFFGKVIIPFFGFAIVNPMGPTFMGFAITKTENAKAGLVENFGFNFEFKNRSDYEFAGVKFNDQ